VTGRCEKIDFGDPPMLIQKALGVPKRVDLELIYSFQSPISKTSVMWAEAGGPWPKLELLQNVRTVISIL